MGKSFSGIVCAVVFSLYLMGFSGGVQAAIIDSFDLNVSSPAGTQSNVILQNGVEYTIEVSGIVDLGSFDPLDPFALGLADAEYFGLDAPAGTPITPIDMFGIDDIGVKINNVDIDWGAFNLGTYTTTFFGLGDTVLLSYADIFYGDNFGSLQVIISDNNTVVVPLPSTIWLFLAGLALLVRQKNIVSHTLSPR